MLELEINPTEDNDPFFTCPETDYKERNHINPELIRFNRSLEYLADLTLLNERILESKLEELEAITSETGILPLLIVSRLTELAILCAANYAGNGLITEMGDLIINPRLIHVHVKNKNEPVVKSRHGRLGMQFKDYCATGHDVVEWIKHNTITEIVKEPIIPNLIVLLKKNGCSTAYLHSVEERVALIVEIAAGTSTRRTVMDIGCQKEHTLDEEEYGEGSEKPFYTFDTLFFRGLGIQIRRLGNGGDRTEA